MSNRPYQVTIGIDGDDPDETFNFVNWAAARRWLLGRLAWFLDDDCPDCLEVGRRAFIDLALSGPEEWHANVDGTDYRISATVVPTGPDYQTSDLEERRDDPT